MSLLSDPHRDQKIARSLFSTFLKEKEYLLLAPVEDKDSENVYVFRIDEVDGKQELNLVEDDKEFIAVKKEYSKLLY